MWKAIRGGVKKKKKKIDISIYPDIVIFIDEIQYIDIKFKYRYIVLGSNEAEGKISDLSHLADGSITISYRHPKISLLYRDEGYR